MKNEKSTKAIGSLARVIIDGEEYDLIIDRGKLMTARGMYVGHFEILAKKGETLYEIKCTNE